jgi:hypothetical protein
MESLLRPRAQFGPGTLSLESEARLAAYWITREPFQREWFSSTGRQLSTHGSIRRAVVGDSFDLGSGRRSDSGVGSSAVVVNNAQASGNRAAAYALDSNT